MNGPLNGKKTYVGIALMTLGAFLSMFGYAEVGEPLRQIGEGLTAVGFAHKLTKAAGPVEVKLTTDVTDTPEEK